MITIYTPTHSALPDGPSFDSMTAASLWILGEADPREWSVTLTSGPDLPLRPIICPPRVTEDVRLIAQPTLDELAVSPGAVWNGRNLTHFEEEAREWRDRMEMDAHGTGEWIEDNRTN